MNSDELKQKLQEKLKENTLQPLLELYYESIKENATRVTELKRVANQWNLCCDQIGNPLLPKHSFALIALWHVNHYSGPVKLHSLENLLNVNYDKLESKLYGTYAWMIINALNTAQ